MLREDKASDQNGSLAERSKALASGASPKGREFESRSCHFGFTEFAEATNLDFTPKAEKKNPAKVKPTPKGFEPSRAEPSGFLVHLLNHSDTVSRRWLCRLATE